MFLDEITGVEMALAISHLPIEGCLGALEAEIDSVQVHQFALGDSVEQQAGPDFGTGRLFAHDGQGFRKPVRTIELGLLQSDDVHEFVFDDLGPVKAFLIGGGRGQSDDPAGRGTDGLDPGQPRHAGTEPLMGTKSLGLVKDFELGARGWLVTKLLRQGPIDLLEIF